MAAAPGPGSDVDILVTFERTPGLLRFVELENSLGDLLGTLFGGIPRLGGFVRNRGSPFLGRLLHRLGGKQYIDSVSILNLSVYLPRR